MEFFFAHRTAALIALGAGVVTVACSSFSGAPTMEENLLNADAGPPTTDVHTTDGADTGSSTDAGSSVEDAGSSVKDAGGSDGSSTDRGDGSVDASSAFCAGSHWLCDNFEGADFVPPWGSQPTANGGTIAHEAMAGGGFSFHATAPAGASNLPSGYVSARLVKGGVGNSTATGLSCSFAYQPKSTANFPTVLAELLLTQASQTEDERVWLISDGSVASIQEGINSQAFAATTDFTPGVWTNVRLTVQFGVGVSLKFDEGSELVSSPTTSGAPTQWQAKGRTGAITMAKLSLGMHRGTGQSGSWEGYFDDVKCDLVEP